jgi:hypothetical protein
MKEKEKEGEKKLDKETEKVKGAEGASLDSLLQRLPGCVSRDLIDQLTVMLSNYNLLVTFISSFLFPVLFMCLLPLVSFFCYKISSALL